MCIGPLFFDLWSDRRRPNYWMGMLAAFLFHGAFLYVARSLFPFKTVLAIIPMAVIEVSLLFVIVLKVLGNQDGAKS